MKEKKDSVLLLENYDYQGGYNFDIKRKEIEGNDKNDFLIRLHSIGSCCDHLQVNDKSDDAGFPHK